MKVEWILKQLLGCLVIGVVLLGAQMIAGAQEEKAPAKEEKKAVGAGEEKAKEEKKPAPEEKAAEKEAEKEAEEEVEEVTVVAPPLIEGNKVNRLGAQVTSVGREQIDDLNAVDIGYALRATPGVSMSRRNLVGGCTGRDTIYIRGMGSRRPGGYVMPLVDGIPRYPVPGKKLHFDNLSVEIADVIDVYKGAQPVLFGQGAFSAVNIRTKRRTEQGFEGRVLGAGGSYGTWYEGVEHGGKIGPFDYYFVHNIRGSSGHRPKADAKVEHWFGRAGLDIGKNFNFAFTIDHTDSWAQDPGRDDEPIPERAKFKLMETAYLWNLTNKFDMADGYLKFYYNDSEKEYEMYGMVKAPGEKKPQARYTENNPCMDAWGIRFRETVRPWEGGEVTLGLDYDVEGTKFEQDCATGDIFNSSREYFYNTQPYLAVSQMFGEKDSLYAIPSGGFRFNEHSEFQNRWTPQAGIVLGYRDTEGHFYYARNVNYPMLQATFTYERWNVPYLMDRNVRDILPEVVDHYEFGVSQKFSDWLKADATVFWDRGYNDFSRVTILPPGKKPKPRYYYGRPQSWHTNGVELTATLTPHPDFSLFSGATFLHARSDGHALPSSPEITFMSGLTWRFLDRFRLNLDAEYISQQYKVNPRTFEWEPFQVPERVNGYFLMNGKLSCRVTPDDSNVKGSVFVAVQNLTDTNYEQFDHYPAPPASAVVGGEIRF